MSSDRRNTVLICCSFEHRALCLDPIEYYRADTVHIFVNKDIETFKNDDQSIRYDDRRVHECDIHNF